MKSSVLTLATEVAAELGLQRPPTLFGVYDEGDTTAIKLRRAVTKTARFLHRYWAWPDLVAEHSFTSVANGAQANALPSDFERVVPYSGIDRTNRAPVIGPVSSDRYRELTLALPSRPVMMVRGGVVSLLSPYAVGATIEYSYVRDRIARGADNALKAAVTADTDTLLWDDELMHLGVLWAYQQRDGLQQGEDYEAFVAALHNRMAHEAPSDTLDMGAADSDADPQKPNFPVTGWGG